MEVIPNQQILSNFMKILLIIIVTLIAFIVLYYIIKKFNSQKKKITTIEKYFSSISNNDMPKLILCTQSNNISGRLLFNEISRINLKINGKQLDKVKIERAVSSYLNGKVDKVQKEHIKYLRSLQLIDSTPESIESLRPRIVLAAFLENTFRQTTNFLKNIFTHSETTPQKNLIHELISNIHLQGYAFFIYNMISSIFNSQETEDLNYVISVKKYITSIKVINSNKLQLKVRYDTVDIREQSDADTHYTKTSINPEPTHKIKSISLSFTMSSKAEDISSDILYKNIRLKLHAPKTMKQFIGKIKPTKPTKENANKAILISSHNNILVYQLPDFISHGLSHLTTIGQCIKSQVQHQR